MAMAVTVPPSTVPHFSCSYAKRSAKCKKCSTLIVKGELRVINHQTDAKWEFPQHYHKLCFFARSNRTNRGLLNTEQLEVTEETKSNAAWAADEAFIVQSIRKPPKIPGHLLNIPLKKAKQPRRVASKSFTVAPPTSALQQPSEHIVRLITHNVRTLSLGSTPKTNVTVWGESDLLGSSSANLLTFDSHYSDIGATFVGMQETRVLGQTPEAGMRFPGFKFAYHFSGPPEGEVRNFGVGLAIKEDWNDTAKVHHVNDRLLWAQITMGDKTMFVVVAYAPSMLSGVVESATRLSEFYEHMNAVLASINVAASKLGIKSPNLILLGDFNAQLGAGEPDVASEMDLVIGPHCSDRGPPSNQPATTALLEFCLTNSLKDAASFFPPGRSGTGTYHKPCDSALRDKASACPETALGIYSRTIDHVLSRLSPDIETKMCSVVHPAEPLSDHRPVYIDLAVVMVPPQRAIKTGGRQKSTPKPDWSALNCSTNAERVQKKIAEELAKLKQSCLNDSEGLEEEAFNAVKDLIRKVCVDELPSRKRVRQSPDWFEEHAEELRALINTKRVAWKRVCDVGMRLKHGNRTDVTAHRVAWQKARLAVQAACRKYKSDFWAKIAADLNILFERNDMNGFFSAIKRTYGAICGKLDGAEGILSKDESTLHVHTDQIAGRWQEHFSELFNQCVNSNFAKFQALFMPSQRPTASQLGANFTMDELMKVIEEVPKGKATGADMIPNEVYKALFDVDLREMLLQRINGMLNTGVVPSSMKDVIISILYKKDDPRVCNNYRGLSLINHEGKLLERLIQNRLLKYVSSPAGAGIIPTNQFGFQPGKATTDAMWMSRLMGYLAVNKNERLLKCYIDLTKAYDRVDRDILWCILGRYGVPDKMVELIKQLHVGSVARIKLNGTVSTECFGLNNGLKQGSVFAPLLFNIFFGSIMNNCREQFQARGLGATLQFRPDGVILRQEFRNAKTMKRDIIHMSDIAFADDVELFARSVEELQAMLDIIEEVTSCFGQEVSISKSKVLCIDVRQEAPHASSSSTPSASPHTPFSSSSSCAASSPSVRVEGDAGGGGSCVESTQREVHVSIRGKELEVVSEFKYLGCWENNASDMTSELKFRLQRMQGAFHQWSSRVLLHKGVSLKSRLQVFNAVIVANAVYGCPAWTMLSSEIESLESTYFSMLRRVVGCSATTSRVAVMDSARAAGCEVFPLEASIIKRTLRYWGHVARLPANQLHRMVAASIPNLKNHPKLHLGEMLDNSLKAFGIPHHNWVQLAQKIPNPNPSIPPLNPWQKTVDDGVFFFTKAWITGQLRADRIAEAMTLTGVKQSKLIQHLDDLMTTKPMEQKTLQLHQLLIDITNSPIRSSWRKFQPTPALPISPPHPLVVFLDSLRGLSKKDRQTAWAEGKRKPAAACPLPVQATPPKMPVEDPALLAVEAATPLVVAPPSPAELAAAPLAVTLPLPSTATAVALPKENSLPTPLYELGFTEEALVNLLQLAASGELQSQEHHGPTDGNEFLLFEGNEEHASAIEEECNGAVVHPSQHPVILPSSLAAATAALAEPWAASDGVLCDSCWTTADQSGTEELICRRIHSGGLHSCLQIVHLGMERRRAKRSAVAVTALPTAEIAVKAGGAAYWKYRHGIANSPLTDNQEPSAEPGLELWWTSGPPSALRQLCAQPDQVSMDKATITPPPAEKKRNTSGSHELRNSQKHAAFRIARMDRGQASDFFNESPFPDCDMHGGAYPPYLGAEDAKLTVEANPHRRTRWGPAWIPQAAQPVFPFLCPTWPPPVAALAMGPHDAITTPMEVSAAGVIPDSRTRKRNRPRCGEEDDTNTSQMREGGVAVTSEEEAGGTVEASFVGAAAIRDCEEDIMVESACEKGEARGHGSSSANGASNKRNSRARMRAKAAATRMLVSSRTGESPGAV